MAPPARVCGALHHPAPAAPAPSHVTEAACNKAAQAAASAAAEASKASTAAGEAKAAAQTQRDTLYARAAAFLAHRRQHYTGPQADALTPDELQTALQAQHDSLRRGLAEVHDRMANAESRKKDLEKLTRQKAQLQAQRPDQANAVEQARTAQANAEKPPRKPQTRLAEEQKNLPWPDAAAMAAAVPRPKNSAAPCKPHWMPPPKAVMLFPKNLLRPKAPPKPWPNRPGIPPAARTLPPSSRPLLHCKLSAKTCATKTRPPCTGWIPTAMP